MRKKSDLLYLLGEDGVVSLSTHTLPLPGLGIVQIINISDHHGLAVIEFNNAVVRSIKIKITELTKIIKIKIIKVTMIIKIKIIKTMLPAAHSRGWP